MKLLNNKANIFKPKKTINKKCKYMAIGAHQDDLEIMAIDGILKAYNNKKHGFVGVVTTDGGGSARDGKYKNYTDKEMKQVRAKEQIKASEIGKYNALISLNYKSKELKDKESLDVIEEYKTIIKTYKPEVIYTHNLCDKHDSHVAVVVKLIKAIRQLNKEDRPKKVYGCEVWRNLDWLNDAEKVVFDVSQNQELSKQLLGVFESQIAGGKRYDLGVVGRRLANATFFASHAVDDASHLVYAMDLTEVCNNANIPIANYAIKAVDNFKLDVEKKINKF